MTGVLVRSRLRAVLPMVTQEIKPCENGASYWKGEATGQRN